MLCSTFKYLCHETCKIMQATTVLATYPDILRSCLQPDLFNLISKKMLL